MEQKRKDAISLRRQLDRANEFAKNLREGTVSVDDYNVHPYNKESSSHRAKQNDVYMESSSGEDDPPSHKNTKKAFRVRSTRSKKFNESLNLAKLAKIRLVQIHDIHPTKKVFEVDQHGKHRLVEISETVSCDCSFGSKNEVCLHVIWVLMNILKVNVNDNLLHQKSHSKETICRWFRTLVKSNSNEANPLEKPQASVRTVQPSHSMSRPPVTRLHDHTSSNTSLNIHSSRDAASYHPVHTTPRPAPIATFHSNVLQPIQLPSTRGPMTGSRAPSGPSTPIRPIREDISIPRPSPRPGQYIVTSLLYCHPNVSTCFGCGVPLKFGEQPNIPPPPDDLVVVSMMPRQYTTGGETRTRMSNVYFHANEGCIKMRLPYFSSTLVSIQVGFPPLKPVDNVYLLSNLNFSV